MTKKIEQAQLSVLDFPDNVRTETSMYLRDINHSIYEIIDNSVDEHSAGYCNKIDVSINTEKMYIEVQDNGRGIPVTPIKDNPKYEGIPQAILAFSVLHAGGKFKKEGGYNVATGGCHGVGSACTNATSTIFVVAIATDGKLYSCKFEKGILVKKLTCKKEGIKGTGTCIGFIPDKTVWGEDTKIDFSALDKRLRQTAYLNPGLTINYTVDDKKTVYHFESGIKDFINDITVKKDKLIDSEYFSSEEDTSKIEVAFNVTSDYRKSRKTHDFNRGI